jgi:hypothetical protein
MARAADVVLSVRIGEDAPVFSRPFGPSSLKKTGSG